MSIKESSKSIFLLLLLCISCKSKIETNTQRIEDKSNYLEGIINYVFINYYEKDCLMVDSSNYPSFAFDLLLINHSKDSLYLMVNELSIEKVVKSRLIAVYGADTMNVYAARTGTKGCYLNPKDSARFTLKIANEDFKSKFDPNIFKDYKEFAKYVVKEAQFKYLPNLTDTSLVNKEEYFKIPDSIYIKRRKDFFIVYKDPNVTVVE